MFWCKSRIGSPRNQFARCCGCTGAHLRAAGEAKTCHDFHVRATAAVGVGLATVQSDLNSPSMRRGDEYLMHCAQIAVCWYSPVYRPDPIRAIQRGLQIKLNAKPRWSDKNGYPSLFRSNTLRSTAPTITFSE